MHDFSNVPLTTLLNNQGVFLGKKIEKTKKLPYLQNSKKNGKYTFIQEI